MSDVEARLARLEAAEAIRNLRASYAYACDEGFDAERLADHYTEDAVLDNGEAGALRGRAEIAAYFAGVPQTLPWCSHYMTTSSIEVAADARTATGRWYFLEPCDLGGEAFWVMGVYHDAYAFTDDGWKLASVRNEARAITPYASGWVKERFPKAEISWGQEAEA